MSYILEALKKSQQERELGQVPTLDTVPLSLETKQAHPTPWLMIAVGLALLAVIIALYAALRGLPVEPKLESSLVNKEAAVTEPPAPVKKSAASAVHEKVDAASSPEPPLSPAGSGVPGAKPANAADTAPVAAAAPARPRPTPSPAAVSMEKPSKDKIPDDLRRDIEAFKDDLRNERSGSKPKTKSRAERDRPQAKVPPQKLRLPSDVQDRLPAFLMTAHVFDKDPAKRFVLINALKAREGERTREGITVEEILPDGAVLSYEGHRFFQER